MDKPLVTVICLCYNHERYVAEAIDSALNQSYGEIELIVVDDASTDNSRSEILKLAQIHGFKTHFNDNNVGNCKSFNIGLALSHGKYIIDLAADDLLRTDRVAVGVVSLEQHGSSFGVHFCDVALIDEKGQSLGTHFKRDEHGKLVENVPEGAIFEDLVERYFISTPSMMMSRTVLDKLRGYDENLSYEDFDFWVRSSRKFNYAFTDQVLVQKRILPKSLSFNQHQKKNKHLLSTAIVCEKAFTLCETEKEKKALIRRINYELKWALITENWEAAELFIKLKEKMHSKSIRTPFEKLILLIQPPWFTLWKSVIP